MTLPAGNQQTVEALEARVLRGINNSPVNWDGGRSSWADDARAALRDLAAQAELAAELGDALAESLQHPDHVSDEVRKERNHHALTLLTRLDASRSLDWWGDDAARLDGAR
jgi:hypothetical protein